MHHAYEKVLFFTTGLQVSAHHYNMEHGLLLLLGPWRACLQKRFAGVRHDDVLALAARGSCQLLPELLHGERPGLAHIDASSVAAR